VPALAEILNIKEYELYHVAGVLPREIEASLSLSAAASDLRTSFQLAWRALAGVGLSSAGEALVIDRILRNDLDFRITVWPVVRGASKPIQLHSWIVLEPVEPVMGRRRHAVETLQSLSYADRRSYIRREMITESLWCSLGLRWLPDPGPEWPYGPEPELCIEVPIEERNREPLPGASGQLGGVRLLALSAPFAHGELLVAFLAEALGFGSYDLRYQGFNSPTLDVSEANRFCRQKLAENAAGYAWSIAQTAELLNSLRDAILLSSEHHLLILLTYGSIRRALAKRTWRLSDAELRSSSRLAIEIAVQVNEEKPVIWVDYEDSDYLTAPGGTRRAIDFDAMIDHVRYTAAEVLNCLYLHRNGPAVDRWGDRVDDLRYGSSSRAYIPARRSRVEWYEPRTLPRRRKTAP